MSEPRSERRKILVRAAPFALAIGLWLVPIPIGEVVGKTKTVPLDYDLLLTARALGVSFGD